MLQIGRSLVRSQLVSVDFFFDIKSFRSHYGPGVDSTSNRNEYREYFLGVNAAGADNLPPSCAVVTKSGNLNLLEPSVMGLLYLYPLCRWGWVGNATSWPLYPQERPGTRCVGGWVDPQGRSGQVRKISPSTVIRSPDRSTRSELLYRHQVQVRI